MIICTDQSLSGWAVLSPHSWTRSRLTQRERERATCGSSMSGPLGRLMNVWSFKSLPPRPGQPIHNELQFPGLPSSTPLHHRRSPHKHCYSIFKAQPSCHCVSSEQTGITLLESLSAVGQASSNKQDQTRGFFLFSSLQMCFSSALPFDFSAFLLKKKKKRERERDRTMPTQHEIFTWVYDTSPLCWAAPPPASLSVWDLSACGKP